jgi:hypothetical protein
MRLTISMESTAGLAQPRQIGTARPAVHAPLDKAQEIRLAPCQADSSQERPVKRRI